jgi:uncharacterized protein
VTSDVGQPQAWAECRETHLSAVFLAGDRVLKFKKPVRTAFVDFTSLDARETACQEEVRLNSRLSPDVYLGVAHIGLHDAGPGEPVVVMRRLRDRDQLGERLATDDPAAREQMREVARCLAIFHSECVVHDEPDSPGSWESVRQAWLRECAEVALLGDAVADRATLNTLRTLGLFYLDGRRPLFDSRSQAGQVVDGHGDLRCEHVYLTDDGVRVIDCVEFDQSLRIADVVCDLAFLAMDLEGLGSPDCAVELLRHYRELTASTYPLTLLDFYIGYRSIVRAKVGAIRAHETGTVDPEVSRLIELAVLHLRRATPVIVCLGGLPGSGKSTLSEEFARTAGAVHLSSDEIRHGLRARQSSSDDADSWEIGAYTPSATDDVYRVLLDRAETALSEGCSVVLDASWRDATQRDRVHALALQYCAVPVDVRCEIAENTAFRRLARTRSGFSEAGVRTRESMKSAFEPWPDAQVLATDRDVTEVLPDLQRIVERSVDECVQRDRASAL